MSQYICIIINTNYCTYVLDQEKFKRGTLPRDACPPNLSLLNSVNDYDVHATIDTYYC